jgi:hypothetical protein
VWTGTSRTPNVYRGKLRERTFETAFLEYGAMQNLVRSSGRTVWYLNDPVEDNPDHDWNDYRGNWESTLVASLFQPEVWRFEVAPWPERVFNGKYPKRAKPEERESIPPPYATELQTVMNALNDMHQKRVEWDCGTIGLGLLVSDSLMFERGETVSSDAHLGHVYGLALPLLKRGLPLTPVQLENIDETGYLAGFKVLLLTYHGMKPLTPQVHDALARWVKNGGSLLVCDDDGDPYNSVREWWNRDGLQYATPREHLFERLGLDPARWAANAPGSQGNLLSQRAGKGFVLWLKENPARLASDEHGDTTVAAAAKEAAARAGLAWRETNYLLLRRGPYLIGAGLDETTVVKPKSIRGSFVDLFSPELALRDEVKFLPGSHFLLLDLTAMAGTEPRLLASACKALPLKSPGGPLCFLVEGVARTPSVVLLRSARRPHSIALDGKTLDSFDVVPGAKLLRIRFQNESFPRRLEVRF